MDIPGKWTILMVVIMLVGLAVCAQRVLYWNNEAEEAVQALYESVHDTEQWKNHQRLLISRANGNITLWMTAALIWGIVCIVMVYLVNRWEEDQLLEPEPVPPGPT